MSKAPSMPMFWDAYLADTTHLSTEEHGAYLLLLAAMWRRNGSVPDDDADNARILGLSKAKWRKVKARLSGFLIIENGEISQKNLQKIWENTQEKIEKNRANGAVGGRAAARKNKDLGQANAKDSLQRKASIPEPEPEPEFKKEDTNVSLQVSPAGDVSEAVRIYNDAAERAGWPSVQKLTPQRSRNLKARIGEAGGMDGWRHAIDLATESDFLCGRTAKPWGGFGFDWICKAGNFTKLMEGNYDNRTGNPSAGNGNRNSGTADAFLDVAAKYAGCGTVGGGYDGF